MNIMNRLERKLYRLRVEPFFRYIIFAMAGVYLLQMLFPPFNLISKLLLVMPMVYLGEVWRLISFLIVPPLYDPFSALLNMYFYYFIGTSLESKWGARRFLLYFLLGALGAVLAALITQVGTNHVDVFRIFFAASGAGVVAFLRLACQDEVVGPVQRCLLHIHVHRGRLAAARGHDIQPAQPLPVLRRRHADHDTRFYQSLAA